jgi:hypothetical protein
MVHNGLAMCSLSTFLTNKLDSDVLQTLCSKQIRRKYLSGKLHIGDVSKFVLMFANAPCMVTYGMQWNMHYTNCCVYVRIVNK